MTRRGSGGVGGGQAQGPVPMLPAEFELVLIDGDNLLHRVRGMRDEAGLRWLLPRLRAWLPRGTRALVMLDGHPDPGDSYHRHAATGVDFQHSGNNTADTALVGTLAARPYADRARTVVVSDDRALGDRVRRAGGLVRRLDWLVGGLAAAVGDVGFEAGSSSQSAMGSARGSAGPAGSGGSNPRSLRPAESSQGIVTAGMRPVGIGGGSRSRPGINRGPRQGRGTSDASRPRSADARARDSGDARARDSGDARARDSGEGRALDSGTPGAASSDAGAPPDREPWKPGRGATRKHGNPKREPRRGA